MSTVHACPLSHQLIRISGVDKLAYLHGQITQDINKLNQTNFLWAGHCNAKGKLWSVAKLFAYQDSYYLAASAVETAQSLTELKKYAVFSKVEIHAATSKLIGLIGDDLAATLNALNIHFNEQDSACDFSHGKALKLAKNRILLMVNDEFSLPDEVIALENDALWHQHSILAGEPELNEAALGEYVPQMVNLQAIGGVSFRKGCYTGQETVARMKYLGKNKRAMYIVSGHSDGELAEPELETQMGENWRRAGKLISQAYNQQSKTLFGLVVLPNDSETSQLLRAKHAPTVELSILPLPYSLEDE
ncbi:tRNA-modifying protein YgfZ [Pseudoalteromonas sp. SR44-5]|uniref:tRNA-modifying protein YgfZ n=1 Tax=unclassified Pseudoalteromonas TaxID=194690 RepID=UPI001600AA4E|nr:MULTISPECIES: tRNA-modifying protein YgfZ [unclassified Pseudoalteromonas]MBB1333066.1 tRNA-modifying protein YgfZ [Pseudoalteromonas sp. SR41-6]MBB1364810.1 tRNA-modifying protein YgfZ [Pseudoalteromonas sp. SR44-5]MBB1422911.1 tRNA-modifying protein YgfZ [Pseudoalteromonas sp. SG43-7]MBB1457937.1 tRNA-modifying protein YgfZ [Pseudoalteromonas sp. SG41-8]MBB1468061.1 tRNA-modifying protein YgfZ [Pseudoalteromonas sp. SG41-5]